MLVVIHWTISIHHIVYKLKIHTYNDKRNQIYELYPALEWFKQFV